MRSKKLQGGKKMSKFEKSKFEEWLKKYYDVRSSRYTFEYIYRKTELKEQITQDKIQWYEDKIREDKIEQRTWIDSEVLNELGGAPSQSPIEEKNVFLDVQHYEYKYPYDQRVVWGDDVFKQVSDILEDTTITEVTVQDSRFSYITPIKINKTLANIIDAIQLYYNQISKDDKHMKVYTNHRMGWFLSWIEQKKGRNNDIIIEFLDLKSERYGKILKGFSNKPVSQSLKEVKNILLDVQHYKDEDHYLQCVDWYLSVFKQISDILDDIIITEVSVQDSSYSYITPIRTSKTLSNIIDAIELFYIQISKDDRRTTFYLESIKPFERKKSHVVLEITHGKLYTWEAQFFRSRTYLLE